MASRDLADAHPVLAERVRLVQARFPEIRPSHELHLTCVYRSPAEQFELYKKGRRLDEDGKWYLQDRGKRVTNADGVTAISKHNMQPARAVDVVVVLAGKYLWAEEEYEPLGPLAIEVGLVWGGTWPRFRDLPHLELAPDIV